MRRRGSDGHDEESFLEQIRRASRSGGLEFQSRRRLAAAFADYDAELAARFEKDSGVSYKYQCRFCHSRFSLAQQLEEHEAACGKVGQDKEKSMPGKGQRPISCRHCGHTSPSLKDHAAHLLEAHREMTLARRRQLAIVRKAEDEKITAAETTAPAVPPRRARPVHAPSAAAVNADPGPPRPRNGHDPSCPTCGGPLPAATAQLVTEFTRAGIPEAQAFNLVRTARQLLAPRPAA